MKLDINGIHAELPNIKKKEIPIIFNYKGLSLIIQDYFYLQD